MLDNFGGWWWSRAAGSGYKEVVVELLKHGAEVDKPRPDGKTALMAAAAEGVRDCVTVLLEHGADVDTKNEKSQQTALMEAAFRGQVSCAQTTEWVTFGRRLKQAVPS